MAALLLSAETMSCAASRGATVALPLLTRFLSSTFGGLAGACGGGTPAQCACGARALHTGAALASAAQPALSATHDHHHLHHGWPSSQASTSGRPPGHVHLVPQQAALPSGPYRAVLIDAAGTLIVPTEPTAEVLLRYARPHGCSLSEREVLDRFRR